MHCSYDYTGLIKEIENDLKEGLIRNSDKLEIVRSNNLVFNNYSHIVDYYYPDNNTEERFELVAVTDVLAEMKKFNAII